MSVHVSVCFCVSLCEYLPVSVSVCVSVRPCASVYLYVCFSVSLSPLIPSLSLSLSHSLSLSLYLSIFLSSLALRPSLARGMSVGDIPLCGRHSSSQKTPPALARTASARP